LPRGYFDLTGVFEPMDVTASPLTELTHIALSLDALNCGAMLVSRNGIIAHANPRLCEMMQARYEKLVGANLIELYPALESQQLVRDMLSDIDRARDAEFFLPISDEKRLPVVFSARVVGKNSFLNEYAVITLIDISSQKMAEERLLEQNRLIGELSDKVMQQTSILREYTESLEERVRERTAQLHDAHMETIYILAMASEAKDEDTASHVRRLRRFSQAIARQMGMSADEAENIGYAAVLHDVGKIHTPDVVLKKPGPLTPEENIRMREHTLAGERILQPSQYFAQASRVARSHHENWDGSGYPDGLRGEAIPIEARIVHVADVYDALVHSRIYKPARDRALAIEEIHQGRGTMFDPKVVDAFEALEKVGELRRLEKMER
jgi:putative nucleotidyltransferase with HDIG domain/PAS domain S-box-containing protein